MRSYHEKLMEAVIKHVKEVPLLDEWFKGNTVVKFGCGVTSGMYAGNGMLRSDAGGVTVNLDPSKITGVYFENIIREEDAELAFKGLTEKNRDLQEDVLKLRSELKASELRYDDLDAVLTLAGEREVRLNKKIDALQAADPTGGSEQPDEPSLNGQEGSEGFGSETKEAAGISDLPRHPSDTKEKVTITKDDIGTLDAASLGLTKEKKG